MAVLQYLIEPLKEKELVRIFQQAAEQEAEVLDLSERGIDELPNNIKLIPNLKVLKLNNNYISSLPQEISKLRNLQRLELLGNIMRFNPSQIKLVLVGIVIFDFNICKPIRLDAIDSIQSHIYTICNISKCLAN